MVSIYLYFLVVFGAFIDKNNGDNKINNKPIWNSTFIDKLRHDLLLNYDKFARPTQHYNLTTVSFGFNLRYLEVNELKSTITLSTILQFVWNDDKLKWNSSDYGGVVSVQLGEHEVWQPDIFLYNSATAASVINQYGNALCILYYDGKIIWVPPAQFSAICKLNLKYWPYDTQTCQFIFGSWTHHGNEVDLQLRDSHIDTERDRLTALSEWEVLHTVQERILKYYPCCQEAYPQIRVNLTLQRTSDMYGAFITAPTIAIIMLTLLSFWLPPQAGEKVLLNGCLAIIVVLYLLYFARKLPALAMNVPLIVNFFSSSLYVICLSMFNSIVVIWLARTQHTKTLPWILKQPLTGFFKKWLLLGDCIDESNVNYNESTTIEEMRDHQVTNYEERDSNEEENHISIIKVKPIQQDWLLLAVAIDRLAFIFYSFLFTILSISYLI